MASPPPDVSTFTWVALTGDQSDLIRLLVYAVVVGLAVVIFAVTAAGSALAWRR